MRRYLNDQPESQKLFRGREFMRLMTMIVMLGVVWSLISTARQPSTWKFLAQEAENDNYTMSELRNLEAKEQQVALAGFMQSTTGDKAVDPAPAEAAKRDAEKPEAAKTEPAKAEPAKAEPAKAEPAKAETDKPATEEPKADKPEPVVTEPAKSEPLKADGEKVEPGKAEPAKAEADKAAPPSAPPTADNTAQTKTMEEVESLKQGLKRKFDPQPLDLDPEQRKRLDTEFQAIQDKRALSKEEMPAYWRLMRWQWGQSTDTLRERARKDVYFTHLWQKPEKFRGELIRLRLHIKRTLTDTSQNNIPGVTRMYESWGTTDEAHNQFYVVAYSDLPSDKMPMGPGIEEEAVFYGYFFKLLGYTGKDEKFRASPMLVGRIVWCPTAPPPPPSDWTWPLIIIGGVVVMVGARIMFMILKPKPRQPVLNRGVRLNDFGEEAVPVEDWLDQAEQPEEHDGEERPTNGHHYLDSRRNGNSLHPRFSSDFDRNEDELN